MYRLGVFFSVSGDTPPGTSSPFWLTTGMFFSLAARTEPPMSL